MVLSTLLAASLALAELPLPMDGVLRWDTNPDDGEAALVESGAEGQVHTNGVQVWMDIRIDGAEGTLTWDDRDRLFWVEVIREYPDRASALAALERLRRAAPAPDAVHDVQDGVVVQWDRPDFHHALWLAPSEKTPGHWSMGRKWQRRSR